MRGPSWAVLLQDTMTKCGGGGDVGLLREFEAVYVPDENGRFKRVPANKEKGRRIKMSSISLLLSSILLLAWLGCFTLLVSWLVSLSTKIEKQSEEVARLESQFEKQDDYNNGNFGGLDRKGADSYQGDADSLNSMVEGGYKAGRACHLQPDAGPCTTVSMQRWYYDISSGGCKQFSYGGCWGNSNNFHTVLACEQTCKDAASRKVMPISTTTQPLPTPTVVAVGAEHCFLKPQAGPCRGTLTRCYWNGETGQCDKFSYGGCAGNKNNFVFQQECEDACKLKEASVKSVAFCDLEPLKGPCKGNLTRWHFDSSAGLCKEFGWGGCGGNENNFPSLDECQASCGRRPV